MVQIDRQLVGFGLFLGIAGGVTMAVRLGALSEVVGSRTFSLGPRLLISGGVSIVLERRPGAAIGRLVVANAGSLSLDPATSCAA